MNDTDTTGLDKLPEQPQTDAVTEEASIGSDNPRPDTFEQTIRIEIQRNLVGVTAPQPDVDDCVAAILAAHNKMVNKARHDQRHEDIGVSKWIKVGEEWGHWNHPMTARKCRDTLAFPETTRRAE